jgi:F-type H+-transporting ATPase subunit b
MPSLSDMLVLAAEGGDEGGSFLIQPSIGLMIWLLIVFGLTYLVLQKLAFPRIQAALEKRQRLIEDSIDTAERTKREADQLLEEYRERLAQARTQADEIVARARKTAEHYETEGVAEARRKREELMEQTRRQIQKETEHSLRQIRAEVANLTVMATEKVTRKSLDEDDQRRLVEEALSELDFETLAGRSR